MASTIRGSLLFLTCCLLIVQAGSYELTQEMMSLFSVFNGVFKDTAQLKEGYIDHDRISLTFRPVILDAITEGPVIYSEEKVNGEIYRQEFFVLIQDKRGLLYFVFYNVTEDKAKNVNPDDLSNIKREDLQTAKDCVLVYMKVQTGIYSGDRQDCRHLIGGKHPGYGVTLSCTSFNIVVPLTAHENSTLIPYDLLRIGTRYKSQYKFKNFVPPCPDDDNYKNNE